MTAVAERTAPAQPRADQTAEARGTRSYRNTVGDDFGAEVALGAVTLSIVVGLGRLFASASFLPPLITISIIGHLTAAVTRRKGVRTVPAAAIGLLAGFLVILWVRYPDTTSFGIPRRASLSVPRADLREAWRQFGEVAAPAPVTGGFVLASAIAIWGVAWFSDWAALRLGLVVEAVLPAGAVFLFCAMLGAPDHRIAATAAFALAVLIFSLVQLTHQRRRRSVWVGNGAAAGTASVRRAGVALVAVALTAGVVVGPHLPGASSDSLIDWRGDGNRSTTRITVSPLVDIRKRLVNQSDLVVFTVQSNRRAYWRLTSVDSFDGTQWSLGGSFARAKGDLPGTADPAPADAVDQAYSIRGLAAIWLPAAFTPVRVTTNETGVRWDDESGTLIVDSSADSSDNVTYRVISNQPIHTAKELDNPPERGPKSIDQRYLQLPASFPDSIRRQAEAITGPGKTTYQRALALQNYFRNGFQYDLTTPAGQGDRAMQSFIESRRGYCEQFAGTFAAMARSVGIPSRVAVGFTPGDPDPEQPGRFIVRGRHAHAWPEVWIAGEGWIAFEPTPGRGMPGAQSYTNVPEQQAGADGTTPTAPTTTAPGAVDTPIPSAPNRADQLETANQSRSGGGGRSGSLPQQVAVLLVAAAILALLWVLGLAVAQRWRRDRRRREATTATSRIRVAWAEGAEWAGRLAGPLRASETEREFAKRSRRSLGSAAAPLDRLAEMASVAHWAPAGGAAAGGSEMEADEAFRLSAGIEQEVRARIDHRRRLRHALDPRPLFGS